MKGLAVILVLLNLAAWLLGIKSGPSAAQFASVGQFETINAAGMSVIKPPMAQNALESGGALESEALEEDAMAQLKMDKRGQVLMAPGSTIPSAATRVQSEQITRVIVPNEPSKPAVKSGTEPDPEPGPEADPQALASVVPAIAQVVLEKTEKPVLFCYRLGPFADQDSLASVKRKLASSGIRYRVEEESNAKNIKAVRVYFVADPGPKALEATKKRLETMGIEYFVTKVNGVQIVQLGSYSQPAYALAYQKTLKGRGIEALTETIYHKTSVNSWLDVQLAPTERIASLNLSAPVRAKKQVCQS